MDHSSLVWCKQAVARKEKWSGTAVTVGSGVALTAGSAEHLPRIWHCPASVPTVLGVVVADAKSPSQPCPLLPEAVSQEGPDSMSPQPLTVLCPAGSRCHVSYLLHLTPSWGQSLGIPPNPH